MSSESFDAVDNIIAQWGDERPALDASPMGLGRIVRLANHLRKSLNDLLQEFEINSGEFDVLATLRRSGAPYELTPTALFKSMMVSSGTMTNRLDRLEASGLVERGPDPSDRRGTLIRLTDKGFSLIDTAVDKHVKNGDRILSALSPADREDLMDLLRKLLLSLEAS